MGRFSYWVGLIELRLHINVVLIVTHQMYCYSPFGKPFYIIQDELIIHISIIHTRRAKNFYFILSSLANLLGLTLDI